MQNEPKLSAETINNLINMLKNGNVSNEQLKSTLESKLGQNQMQKINSLLSDPEKLRALLNSPQVKSLLGKLGKTPSGENGEQHN